MKVASRSRSKTKAAKDDTGPLSEQSGNVTVPIYRTESGKYSGFTVSWYEGGKRKRKVFAQLSEARELARSVASKIAKQQLDARSLGAHEALTYAACIQKLRPLDIDLLTAVEEFVAARKIVKNHPMLDALRFWQANHGGSVTDKPLPDVVSEFLIALKKDGVSEGHQDESRRFLGHVSNRFRMNIGEITTPMLDEYLRSMSCSAGSRNTYRRRLVGFFNFARRAGYLPDRTTAADRAAKAKEAAHEIEIYSPQDLQTLLLATPQSLKAFIVLCAFCGLRAAEAMRVDWREVRFDQGFIEVKASKAKTASRRLATIPENAKAWLTPLRKATGPVVELKEIVNALRRLERSVNEKLRDRDLPLLQMPRNGLRHSFVSYRLAVTQNVAQTAHEAGHDAKVLFRHYRELVSKADAERYFAIFPPTEQDTPVA